MTEAEFIDTVAEQLGILAAGQSLSNEDAQIIRRRMAATFARLASEEITTVASDNDIPADQALALADIVAFDCATPFGLGGRLGEFSALAEKGIASLRMVTSERPYRDTLPQVRWWGGRRLGSYTGTG